MITELIVAYVRALNRFQVTDKAWREADEARKKAINQREFAERSLVDALKSGVAVTYDGFVYMRSGNCVECMKVESAEQIERANFLGGGK